MTEARLVFSDKGEERDTQLCLLRSHRETEYQMDERMMDNVDVYDMSQQRAELVLITADSVMN
jgi:hypothetical protein